VVAPADPEEDLRMHFPLSFGNVHKPQGGGGAGLQEALAKTRCGSFAARTLARSLAACLTPRCSAQARGR
jgi:hypothetical protein